MTLNGVAAAPQWQAVGREEEVFRHACAHRLPLLLKGPTGCGKTRFIEYMAHQLERPLITVVCHEETSAVDLLGRYLLHGSETEWHDGPLTRAVRTGAILYLDEIAEAQPDVMVAIHPLSDYRRRLYLDRRSEVIDAAEGFMLVASYNPGYQRGFKELKPSTRQRFVTLSFRFPSPERELEIVVVEGGCSRDQAQRLVQLASRVRAVPIPGLEETISTRLLISAAALMAGGMAERLASEVAIVEAVSDEPEVTTALRDLVALLF